MIFNGKKYYWNLYQTSVIGAIFGANFKAELRLDSDWLMLYIEYTTSLNIPIFMPALFSLY